MIVSNRAALEDVQFIEEVQTGIAAFNAWRLFNPIALIRIAHLLHTIPQEGTLLVEAGNSFLPSFDIFTAGLPNANLSVSAQERTMTYLFRGNFGNAAYAELLALERVR